MGRMASGVIAAVGLALGALAGDLAPAAAQAGAASPAWSDYFEPLAPPAPQDPARAALGRALFHEPRLSGDGTVSCASCHNLARGGVDGRATSTGITGVPSRRNCTSVYNLEGHIAYFWDGRARTLEDQIDDPMMSADEMGADWGDVISLLRADGEYRRMFRAAYGGPATVARIKDAIATFERTLATPNAPFDRFLRGDAAALTVQQQDGARMFVELGCVSCHQGVLLGANFYQKLGVFHPHPSTEEGGDLGRFDVTGIYADRGYFKVPSLRNVAVTAPYFHDGSVATLEEAVLAMAYYQLGRSLSETERAALVAFLESLTGEGVGYGIEGADVVEVDAGDARVGAAALGLRAGEGRP